MPADDEIHDPAMVEPVRRSIRTATSKLVQSGRVQPIDAAIGALYATHDLALHVGMDAHAAIEWIRTAADLMERQVMDRETGHG